MRILDLNELELVAGGSLYSELNSLYEDFKAGLRAFWKGAKVGYGLE